MKHHPLTLCFAFACFSGSLFAQATAVEADVTTATTDVTVPPDGVVVVQAAETTRPKTEYPVYWGPAPSVSPVGVALTTTVALAPITSASLVLPLPPFPANPGSNVVLRLDGTWAAISQVQWFKNDVPVATGSELVLTEIKVADSGSYRATVVTAGEEKNSAVAQLLVGAGNNHPLVNISTRGAIGPSNPQMIVGFSVPERMAAYYLPKTLLLRAVGPALADLDVVDPLPDPVVHVYDAEGNDVTPVYAFAQIVYDDGSTEESRHYARIADTAAAIGAFPIPVPTAESPTVPDYSQITAFAPGTYTFVVSSASGASGTVLAEIYEVTP